jgi:hypothetical protein
MKSNFLTIVLIAFVSFVYGTNTPNTNNEKAKTIIVNTNEWKGGSVEVSIIDENQNIIFREKVKNTSENRSYNVSKLPAGKYQLQMSNNRKLTRQTFEVFSSHAVLNQDISSMYLPIFNQNEKYLDVNMLSTIGSTEISIIDEANTIISKETIDKPSVHRRYNITNLPNNSKYYVEVNVNGISHYYTFSK